MATYLLLTTHDGYILTAYYSQLLSLIGSTYSYKPNKALLPFNGILHIHLTLFVMYVVLPAESRPHP